MRIKMRWMLFILLLGFSYSATADDLSIGQNGDNEFWMSLNNNVAENGSQATEWQQKWPLEQVRRSPDGTPQKQTIVYCLSGQREGAQLLNKINDDSLTYEAKKASVTGPISDAVEQSYGDNEKNLHSLDDAIKQRKSAAKCQ